MPYARPGAHLRPPNIGCELGPAAKITDVNYIYPNAAGTVDHSDFGKPINVNFGGAGVKATTDEMWMKFDQPIDYVSIQSLDGVLARMINIKGLETSIGSRDKFWSLLDAQWSLSPHIIPIVVNYNPATLSYSNASNKCLFSQAMGSYGNDFNYQYFTNRIENYWTPLTLDEPGCHLVKAYSDGDGGSSTGDVGVEYDSTLHGALGVSHSAMTVWFQTVSPNLFQATDYSYREEEEDTVDEFGDPITITHHYSNFIMGEDYRNNPSVIAAAFPFFRVYGLCLRHWVGQFSGPSVFGAVSTKIDNLSVYGQGGLIDLGGVL